MTDEHYLNRHSAISALRTVFTSGIQTSLTKSLRSRLLTSHFLFVHFAVKLFLLVLHAQVQALVPHASQELSLLRCKQATFAFTTFAASEETELTISLALA